jgi:hypothetical protein
LIADPSVQAALVPLVLHVPKCRVRKKKKMRRRMVHPLVKAVWETREPLQLLMLTVAATEHHQTVMQQLMVDALPEACSSIGKCKIKYIV